MPRLNLLLPFSCCLLLFLAACSTPAEPAPTPTPPPTPTSLPPVTFDTFESQLLGFTMDYPDDWIVEANEENGAISFSSEAGLLQADELPEDGALVAVLFIRGGLLDALLPDGTTPSRTDQLGVLSLVQPLFFQPEDGARQATDPRELRINDRAAAQVELARGINDQETRFTLTTFGANGQVVAVLTGTPARSLDANRAVLEAMIASITLE